MENISSVPTIRRAPILIKVLAVAYFVLTVELLSGSYGISFVYAPAFLHYSFIISAILFCLTGIWLWRGKKMGRILSISLSVLGVLWALTSLGRLLAYYENMYLVDLLLRTFSFMPIQILYYSLSINLYALISMVLNVAIVWYLLRSEKVKAFFQKSEIS